MSENQTSANENTAASNGQPNTETPAAAATFIIKIEGQEFPLDASIASDVTLLKTALSPHYPSIKNATITRETGNGQTIISIVKKAEYKGLTCAFRP